REQPRGTVAHPPVGMPQGSNQCRHGADTELLQRFIRRLVDDTLAVFPGGQPLEPRRQRRLAPGLVRALQGREVLRIHLRLPLFQVVSTSSPPSSRSTAYWTSAAQWPTPVSLSGLAPRRTSRTWIRYLRLKAGPLAGEFLAVDRQRLLAPGRLGGDFLR